MSQDLVHQERSGLAQPDCSGQFLWIIIVDGLASPEEHPARLTRAIWLLGICMCLRESQHRLTGLDWQVCGLSRGRQHWTEQEAALRVWLNWKVR